MKPDLREVAKEWQERSKKVSEVARDYDVMDDEDAAQQLRLTVQAATLKLCARELTDFLGNL